MPSVYTVWIGFLVSQLLGGAILDDVLCRDTTLKRRICSAIDPQTPNCLLSKVRVRSWKGSSVISAALDGDGSLIASERHDSVSLLWIHERSRIQGLPELHTVEDSAVGYWVFPVQIQIPGGTAWAQEDVVVRQTNDSFRVFPSWKKSPQP